MNWILFGRARPDKYVLGAPLRSSSCSQLLTSWELTKDNLRSNLLKRVSCGCQVFSPYLFHSTNLLCMFALFVNTDNFGSSFPAALGMACSFDSSFKFSTTKINSTLFFILQVFFTLLSTLLLSPSHQ